ncbi:hypothetical protein FKG96_18345 [Olivibacter sp. LS-1]|jgi:hypothetical protein|uniref:hypothetical protein n=1 Tax=unclassified Olivibacter TaxID=2632301 RepID=UPI0011EA97F7|nr:MULTISPECIES: hypothetical protein [unclassified Olivibacter]MDM8176070.1 hypothetical protein [Olivibacter sp. 47]QEL02696.1 hypothetical protein FKG96_18345 [Olivibacter sp. LS-1]
MTNYKNQTERKPRKKNDELLKGAFEEWFSEFLRFLYPNADDLFDFNHKLVFMDKELLSIIPNRERNSDKRIADLLVKVHMKDGTDKHILINTELEGGNDQDFAKRIYQYHYRIWDRYNISVATVAVFTGDRNQKRPKEYWHQILDTTISFRYRAYHIFDNDEEELLLMDNPFSLVVLACQKSLLEGKIPDEVLGNERLVIAKALIAHKYDRDRILSFLVFLKNFIYIENERINRIFDTEVEKLSGGTIDMGIIETVKQQERNKGKREEAIAIAKEMKKDGLPNSQIAKFTKLSLKEIEKLK